MYLEDGKLFLKIDRWGSTSIDNSTAVPLRTTVADF